MSITGGCQCGAVRYRAEVGEKPHASICHCRMCQKATGGLFAAVVTVNDAQLEWTRGAPSTFESSSLARRGFCASCGTPLTYKWGGGTTAVMLGTFDQPDNLVPRVEYFHGRRHPVLGRLDELKAPFRDESEMDEEMRHVLESKAVHQHPDHDTDRWPPEGGR
jgi:hypothetical protein